MVCEGEIAGRFYLIKHCNFKNEIMHAEKFLQLKSANLVTVFFFFSVCKGIIFISYMLTIVCI